MESMKYLYQNCPSQIQYAFVLGFHMIHLDNIIVLNVKVTFNFVPSGNWGLSNI